jgi:serine/threonine protein phosphatase PrpC
MPSLTSHLLVAVFDGHGGAGAALYASQNLVKVIEATDQWKTYVAEGKENPQLLGEIMQQSFLNIDSLLRTHQQSSPDSSGCTAVTAMITPEFILCANAGDSRCVFGYDHQARALSEDHKPYDEGERRRIEAAGGCVQWKRVDGDLAVSRALGDFQYKTRPDLPAKDQKVMSQPPSPAYHPHHLSSLQVTCFPDIDVWQRTPQDEVLILGCDGVWDVMSTQEGVNSVTEILEQGEENMLLVAEELVDIALLKGISRDSYVFSCLIGFPL